MSDEQDFEQLRALQQHRQKQPPEGFKIKVVSSKDKNDPIDYTHLRCGGHTLMITTWRDTGKTSLSWIAGPMKTVRGIDTQIALLQKARELMGGA